MFRRVSSGKRFEAGALQTSRTGLLKPCRHHIDNGDSCSTPATAKGEEQTDSIPIRIE